jgi:hypothetical protein
VTSSGPMIDHETIAAAAVRLLTIEEEAAGLRRLLDNERMTPGDRAYLSRCFDLLDMEIRAVREFLDHV